MASIFNPVTSYTTYTPLSSTYTSLSSTLSSLASLSSSYTTYTPVSPSYTTYTPVSPTLTITSPPVVTKYDPFTITQKFNTYPVLSTPYYTYPVLKAPIYTVDIDTGMNDSYVVQKDITKHFQYKMLDNWIFNKYPKLLKYLKVNENGDVKVVKNDKEMEDNDITKDSVKVNDIKSDYIEEHIFDENSVREQLMKIMSGLGYKWYDLPYKEQVIRDILSKYIKKKLVNLMDRPRAI
jgi:hypothetical protein